MILPLSASRFLLQVLPPVPPLLDGECSVTKPPEDPPSIHELMDSCSSLDEYYHETCLSVSRVSLKVVLLIPFSYVSFPTELGKIIIL